MQVVVLLRRSAARSGRHFAADQIPQQLDRIGANGAHDRNELHHVNAALAEDNAINEPGLFGNRNTVCASKNPKWRTTVERLQSAFPGYDPI